MGASPQHDTGPAPFSDQRRGSGVGAGRDLLADPVLRAAACLGVLWLIAYASTTAVAAGHPAWRTWLGNVAYLVPIAVGAVLTVVAARRAHGRARWFWSLLGLSNALWLAGELTWSTYAFATTDGAPFPSVADIFYLSSYVLVVPAVVLGFGAGWLGVSRSLLDASVIAVTLGLLGWKLLLQPQLDYGMSLATAVGMAYPLLGLVILTVITVLGYGGHRHVPVSVGLVGAGFAVSALTDVTYTHAVVLHEYAQGGWLNLGWQLEAVLLCLAALGAARHQEEQATATVLPRDGALPLLLAGALLTAVVTLTDGMSGDISVSNGALALLTLSAVVARLAITAREQQRAAQALAEALAEQERLAITDGLTGLHNRRFAEEMLRLESQRCTRAGRPLSVLVLDVDHFKQVNDTYGHAVGDVVLREIGSRLTAAARPSDVVARYGGEEFLVIVPQIAGDGVLEIAERCRLAVRAHVVRAHGYDVAVTVSIGAAAMPEHAPDVDELVRTADRSLYAAKAAGRDRVHLGRTQPALPHPGDLDGLATETASKPVTPALLAPVPAEHAAAPH